MIRTPITADERLARVRENILAFDGPRLPRFDPAVIRRVISICGYGPSLAETWGATIGPVMTTSGAHDFMLAKGVTPAYHVEIDPREHKAWLLTPQKDVKYLINSQCHPALFAKLRGYDVTMWHSFIQEDVDEDARIIQAIEELEPGAVVLAGGSNVGMRALVVARVLGHTHFEMHGFDCCFRGAQHWAGNHMTRNANAVRIEVDGRQFDTSDMMMKSTDDFFTTMRMLPGCRFRVHGDGLLEARLKMFNADPQRATSVGWWKPVNFSLKAA
jgi:uncharacterized Rossmann fold enzyme